jgi:hypothetical protein
MTPLAEFYLVSKVIGASGTAVGGLYGVFHWLSSSYKRSKKTDDNITLLLENHLPHMQATMDKHGEALLGMRSDIRDVGTKVDGMEHRLDDTKAGMHALGEAFVRHLETSVKETKKKTRKL